MLILVVRGKEGYAKIYKHRDVYLIPMLHRRRAHGV